MPDAPDALSSLDDLSDALLQDITDDQATRYVRLLSKASQLLRAAAPHVDARLAAGTLDPTVVATVVAGMVKRVLINPEGASTKSQTVGPYNQSLSFVDRYEGNDGSQVGRGALAVTKSDLAQLAPYQPKSKIGTIRLGAALAPGYGLAADGTFVSDGLAAYPDYGLSDDPTAPVPVPLLGPDASDEG